MLPHRLYQAGRRDLMWQHAALPSDCAHERRSAAGTQRPVPSQIGRPHSPGEAAPHSNRNLSRWSHATSPRTLEGYHLKADWRPICLGLVAAALAAMTSQYGDAVARAVVQQFKLPGVVCFGFVSLFKRSRLDRISQVFSSSTDAAAAEVIKEGSTPDDISIENAIDEEPVSPATAVTELGNVQTPASVWLPYKDTSAQRSRLRARVGPAVVTIGGRLGRGVLFALRLPANFLALCSFKAQQIMLASTGTKLVAVFVAGIPLCLLGGLAYMWTSGKTLLDGMLNAYGALYKIPGVMVIGEINSATAHVMNILWLVGTFTFAIVLGVVTEDIVGTVISIRSGNYPVVAKNHTLILGWNNQTISLLRQIAINKEERGDGIYDGPVVILAERDKEEMDAELRTALRGLVLEWHTRQGAPHSIIDLRRVAAGQAKTVILLNPEGEQDVGKKHVAAILGVQSARAATKPQPFLRLQPQNIAIQVPETAEDVELISAARDIMAASAQKFKLTYLSCKRDMSTLLALSAVQPGVASVYCTIVQQTKRGVEFYLKTFPELTGRSFQEARRAFDDAVLCGYMRGGNGSEPGLHINCPDSDVLEDGDRVIALSETGKFQIVQQRSKSDEERLLTGAELVQRSGETMASAERHRFKPKHIVVLWFEENIRDLLISLAAFAPTGSTVKVISREKPEDFPEETTIRGTTIDFIEGDPAQADLIQKSGIPRSDAIIIGGTLEKLPKEADALTLSLVMLIQECLAGSGRGTKNPAHIIGMVRKPESVEVANFLMERLGKGGATAELIQPDELTSGVISQVAADPDIAPLFASFVYSTEGSEIYLRRPELYDLPEECDISFAQVSELCRLRQEIALGYISEAGDVRMAPHATSIRQYNKNDRILTVADA